MPEKSQLPFEILSLITSVSGLGGIAYHLWRGDVVGWKRWVGAAVLSAVAGGLVALWLWDSLKDTPTRLAAVSVLAGIGGTTIFDFLTVAWENQIKKRVEKWLMKLGF
jgi:hypothetical protein